MKQSEFNILVTNVTAIANQTFTIQCGEFATALAADEKNEISTEPFDNKKHLDNFDFQAILDSGYTQLIELEEELENAWSSADLNSLEKNLGQLPKEYANLAQKITGDELKHWISHTLEAKDDSPFYMIHQQIMALFQRGDIDDDFNDLIREAIAYDDIENLTEIESKISPDQIETDDQMTATAIQSFKVFEWMVQHAHLNDDQVIKILGNCFDDKGTFHHVFSILSPNDAQYSDILSQAKNNNATEIIALLEQLKPA